jgi:hypothetical protein
LSYEAQNLLKLGQNGHLNARNKFSKRFFPNPKISLPVLVEHENPRFWGNQEKSTKLKGLEPCIHYMVGGR